ncbi:hypothetical protein M5K25_004425 [Dendrobium thyrsiflorum]|uniref:Uncharacterized protein n=1 Tax=Dendrobium thyrsiflorum TaxID=117978 RepID=A0ABD0VLW5_DENTH
MGRISEEGSEGGTEGKKKRFEETVEEQSPPPSVRIRRLAISNPVGAVRRLDSNNVNLMQREWTDSVWGRLVDAVRCYLLSCAVRVIILSDTVPMMYSTLWILFY